MAVTLELLHEFDSVLWRTAAPRSAGSMLLLTWHITPQPPDAGMPGGIREVFAEALCSMGEVVYAGDDQDDDVRRSEKLRVRRGFRHLTLNLFKARSTVELLPAFDSATHDWSMNAQWLVVLERAIANEHISGVIKTLYQEWELPDRWPSGVMMIVQAAVDGDGAACFTANRVVEDRFIQGLKGVARVAGFELRIDPVTTADSP